MNKTAIVTGANGFVGSAVTKELLNHGYTVYAVVRAGKEKNLPKAEQGTLLTVNSSLETIKDLKDKLQGQNLEGSTFYHFAWAGSAGPARADASLQLNNVRWSLDAMETAKALGCKRFVMAGSIMEHETFTASYTDGNKPGPAYIYGCGKLTAHAMCMSTAAKIGIELLWPEITNAYGVGELSPRMVNTTIRKCINGENPQFTAGIQNYDFVYITDVARAFRLIGENGKPFHEYLIGSGNAKPLKELLLEMKAAIAPNLDFIFGDVPFTGINLPLSAFDTKKTEQDTGFKAQVSFAEGCRLTRDWLKEQQA